MERAYHLAALMLMMTAIFTLLPATDAELMKIEASIIPRRLSRGEEGTVQLKLTLKQGILISPIPEFIIEFEPTAEINFPKNFFTATDLEIEALEEDGEKYLQFKNPIKILFTVSQEAEKGSHILEGKIKYFARSREEGWCLKTTTKFYVPFYTRSSEVR